MWSRKDSTHETHELSVSEKTSKRKVSVKSPYFTSVTGNSHLTNKPEADGALILQPPPFSPSVLRFTVSRVLKSYVKQYGKERSRNKDLRSHLGIELGTSRTEGRAIISCADPSSLKEKQHIYPVQRSNFQRVGSARRQPRPPGAFPWLWRSVFPPHLQSQGKTPW